MKLIRLRFYLMVSRNSTFVYLTVLISSLIMFSCEEPSFIGSEIQPPSDRFDLKYSGDMNLASYTYNTDSVKTNRLRFSLFGTLNDPVFGFSKGTFATQLGLELPGHSFGSSPQIDSLILFLKFDEFYGDSSVPQEITVFELNDSLMYDSIYYADFDISEMYDEGIPLGTKTYTASENDSVIAVHITNEEFRNKLLLADSASMSSSMNFLEYMKGLYLKAEPLNSEAGCIYKINLLSAESKMAIFYNNESEDSLTYNYIISQGAARVNMYNHDYSGTEFYENLNQSDVQDSVVYVQGMGGLKAKVILEDLVSWRDSVPVAINSARLTVKAENLDDSAADYPIPERLNLYYFTEEGDFVPVVDFFMGSSYFGGRYDEESNSYIFNISSFVQYYISEEIKSNELYIVVQENAINPHRVVLKGSDNSDPVKLEIKYNRF